MQFDSVPMGKPFFRPQFQVDKPMTSKDTIRSLPDLIQFNAENNPHHVFCVQEERREGRTVDLVEITFLKLRDLVARCIEHIASHDIGVDTPKENFLLPIALYLESDVTLFVYLSALLWMGIPVVLLSKRLNPQAVAHLVSKTSATTIICSSRTKLQASEGLSLLETGRQAPKIALALPYMELMLQEAPTQRKISYKDYLVKSPMKDIPKALYLHSSGTTGLPKPIALAHRYPLTYAACHRLKEHEAEGRLNVSTLPLYHGFGLLAPCLSLSTGKPCCFPSSTVVPSSDSTVQLLKSTNAKSLMTVPTILEQVVASSMESEYTELSRLDFVAIGGGALKSAIGDTLKQHGVRLLNHYGATELGPLAHIHIPEDAYDWHFLRIRNDTGLKLTELDTDTDNGQLFRLSGNPLGWNARFEIQDSLVKNSHAAQSEHAEVRIMGRTDDLIVLATGEKVEPQAIESHLESLPIVKTAVVFGEQQDEVGVLVELQSCNDTTADQSSVDLLWTSMQDLNRSLDGHARISSKDAIVIKPQGKEIPRSDKGSVMRKEVYRTFSGELKAAYDRLSSSTTAQTGSAIDKDNIEEGLRSLIQTSLQDRIDSSLWKTEDDFFEHGMDSLEATRLARSLGRLPNAKDFPGLPLGISQPLFIYRNPTLGRLATAMIGGPTFAELDRSLRMQRLRTKHVQELRLCQDLSQKEQSVVLLTGSTGSLGAHLLHDLANNQSVERVICVNRASPKSGSELKATAALRDRQERVNARHGLAFSNEMWNKIELIGSDISSQGLGLKPESRSQIAGQVTHILHNAWPMDFQRTLESFEGQVRAVRNLLDLAKDAKNSQRGRKPKLIFLSSIAVAGRYPGRLVLEQSLSDPNSTVPMGYAEAKWVCEEVLASAVESMGDKVEPVIIRIGQLSGSSTTGYWNPNEHLAAIMRSSRDIAALPALQGTFSWLPVDVAAKVINEISLANRSQERYYHVENPVRQRWSDFLDYLRYNLQAMFPKTLPFEEWLDNALASTGADGIAPLEGFLRDDFRKLSSGELVLDTCNARNASPTLRSHGGISLDLMDKYLQSWKAEGVLQK